MSDHLLTVEDAASYLKISRFTVYKYVEQGVLSHFKKKFGIRFRQKDLDSWLEQDKKNCLPPLQTIAFDLGKPPRNAMVDIGGMCEMGKNSKSKTRLSLSYGAVFLRKKKNGGIRFYVDYRSSKGQRIQKLVPHAITQEDAVLALQHEVAREFNHEYRAQSIEKKIKLLDFVDVYLTNYARVKKRSWRSDEKYIRAQLIPFFGELELHEITPLHVSQFMVKRQRDGVKNSTINRELTVLKKMLAMAMDWGFKIERNPVKKGNFFSEEEYKRDRVLTIEEEQRLFNASAPHLKPIFTCALATGMRYSEILGLTWENVDLDKLQITIRAEFSKSGKQRVIPICGHLHAELSRLKKLRRSVSDHVFLYEDPKTGKFRPVTTVRRAFTMACKRAKIQNLHFHDLRHTVESRLISRGVDPVSVKNILGHANLKTTEIYLHSSMQQMKVAVEKLDPASTGTGPENPPNLLHSCDTEKSEKTSDLVIASSSIN